MAITPNTYAIADNLIGFSHTDRNWLRVKVTRVDERADCVWVVTADLADACTPLVLRMAQVTPIDEEAL